MNVQNPKSIEWVPGNWIPSVGMPTEISSATITSGVPRKKSV